MKKRSVAEISSILSHLLYHAVIIAASAALALSLPTLVSLTANSFSLAWTFVENDKILMLAVDIILAVLIILFFHYGSSVFHDRRLSRMARASGMLFVDLSKKCFARNKMRTLKEQNGIARDVMVIGSTGARTFTDDTGDLHKVISGCREAKIMLLNPYSDAAEVRARSILNPEITVDKLAEQVRHSIAFLKELRLMQKNITLRFYSDVPFLKMAISGDYLWFKHYHAGQDVRLMPEYVFRHTQSEGSLYTFFYQYFLRSWNSADVAEYDFDTDELVYRDRCGSERKRIAFGEPVAAYATAF